MTRRQVMLVRSSFQQISASPDRAAESFYTQLFALQPDLESMFRVDRAIQRQKFMHTLKILVDASDRLDVLLPEAAELGHRHVHLGVRNSHYDLVCTALISAFREQLLSAFTPEVEAAWRELYGIIASAMKGEVIAPLPCTPAE